MLDNIEKEDISGIQKAQGTSVCGVEIQQKSLSNDLESQIKLNFTLKSIRHGFMMKVYSILMVQLGITSGFIALFVFLPSFNHGIKMHGDVVEGAECLAFVLILAILLSKDTRKEFPLNMCLLIGFTILEAFILGAMSSHYEVTSILTAGIISVVTCFCLTLFAYQTRYDFSGSGPYVCVTGVVLVIYGVAIPLLNNNYFQGKLLQPHVFYSGLGSLLFTFYMIYDSQLIISGKHRDPISSEEYILATLTIYMDLLTIFKEILSLLMKRRENEAQKQEKDEQVSDK